MQQINFLKGICTNYKKYKVYQVQDVYTKYKASVEEKSVQNKLKES